MINLYDLAVKWLMQPLLVQLDPKMITGRICVSLNCQILQDPRPRAALQLLELSPQNLQLRR